MYSLFVLLLNLEQTELPSMKGSALSQARSFDEWPRFWLKACFLDTFALTLGFLLKPSLVS